MEAVTIFGVTLEKNYDSHDCSKCACNADSELCRKFAERGCGVTFVWGVPRNSPAPVVVNNSKPGVVHTPTVPQTHQPFVKSGVVLKVNSSEYGHSWSYKYLAGAPDIIDLAKKVLDEGFGTSVQGNFSYIEHEGETFILKETIKLNEGLSELLEQQSVAQQAEEKLSEQELKALKVKWGVKE